MFTETHKLYLRSFNLYLYSFEISLYHFFYICGEIMWTGIVLDAGIISKQFRFKCFYK